MVRMLLNSIVTALLIAAFSICADAQVIRGETYSNGMNVIRNPDGTISVSGTRGGDNSIYVNPNGKKQDQIDRLQHQIDSLKREMNKLEFGGTHDTIFGQTFPVPFDSDITTLPFDDLKNFSIHPHDPIQIYPSPYLENPDPGIVVPNPDFSPYDNIPNPGHDYLTPKPQYPSTPVIPYQNTPKPMTPIPQFKGWHIQLLHDICLHQ